MRSHSSQIGTCEDGRAVESGSQSDDEDVAVDASWSSLCLHARASAETGFSRESREDTECELFNVIVDTYYRGGVYVHDTLASGRRAQFVLVRGELSHCCLRVRELLPLTRETLIVAILGLIPEATLGQNTGTVTAVNINRVSNRLAVQQNVPTTATYESVCPWEKLRGRKVLDALNSKSADT